MDSRILIAHLLCVKRFGMEEKMITILSNLFIKDYTNTSDSRVRQLYGMLCGGVGIVLNVF